MPRNMLMPPKVSFGSVPLGHTTRRLLEGASAWSREDTSRADRESEDAWALVRRGHDLRTAPPGSGPCPTLPLETARMREQMNKTFPSLSHGVPTVGHSLALELQP